MIAIQEKLKKTEFP